MSRPSGGGRGDRGFGGRDGRSGSYRGGDRGSRQGTPIDIAERPRRGGYNPGGRGQGWGGGPDRGADSRGGGGAVRGGGGGGRGGSAFQAPKDSYGFPFEDVECNTDQAMDTVKEYASDLSTKYGFQEWKPDIKNLEVAYEFGLRTGFDDSKTSGPTKVAVNYVTVNKKPKELFVYEIKLMARDRHKNLVSLKNRWCREVIFRNIIRAGSWAALSNSQTWVTDYDLIWSTKPLFQEDAPPPIIQGPTTPELGGVDLKNNPFRIISAALVALPVLPLSGAVAALFRSASGTATQQGDNAVLTRGLNAFITLSARTSTQLANTSLNKFYWTGNQEIPQNPLDHPETLRALAGFFASVRPGMGTDTLLLNMSPIFTPFFAKLTVHEFVNRVLRHAGPNNRAAGYRYARSVLRGKKVRLNVPHPQLANLPAGTRWTVTEVLPDPNNNANIVFNGTAPFIRVEVNVGDANNPLSLRIAGHLLDIEEFQAMRGVLNSAQTSSMIDVARLPPARNAMRVINDALPELDTAAMRNHGFELGNALLRIPACFLQAPELLYKGRHDRAQDAAWNLSGRKFMQPAQTLLVPVLNLGESGSPHPPTVNPILIKTMKEAFVQHGMAPHFDSVQMPIQGPYGVRYDSSDPSTEEALKKSIDAYTQKNRAHRHLVVLPEPSKKFEIYAALKRICDIHLGLKTICVTRENNRKRGTGGDAQFASNVAMKFNFKGAGENHRIGSSAFAPLLKAGTCDTIVLGADVAHPLNTCTPGCPSIASVVGSVDEHFIKFPGSMRLQPGRQESIDKLWDMVKERLLDWAAANKGKLPKRVLFYRDGVSESQYEAVRLKEIPQLERAYKLAQLCLEKKYDECNELGHDPDDDASDGKSAGPKDDTASEALSEPPSQDKEKECSDIAAPKKGEPATEEELQEAVKKLRQSKETFQLTMIVVGKRHNTRFYPTSDQQAIGANKPKPNGNVKPGLLVEKVITNPHCNDFYLQSHQPLAGTGRSAHYFVITNQMGLTSTQLHSVTHAFCYTYAKATRGVSYCAPAYYADRLCDRGRAYLRHWLLDHDNWSTITRRRGEGDYALSCRVVRHLYNDDSWRPHRSMSKYNCKRRNPWHPVMDDIMFYL